MHSLLNSHCFIRVKNNGYPDFETIESGWWNQGGRHGGQRSRAVNLKAISLETKEIFCTQQWPRCKRRERWLKNLLKQKNKQEYKGNQADETNELREGTIEKNGRNEASNSAPCESVRLSHNMAAGSLWSVRLSHNMAVGCSVRPSITQ